MTQTTTEVTTQPVTLLDVRTGEVLRLDVPNADTLELAQAAADVVGAGKDALADAEGVILAELLRRLDRAGEWTKRVGDPEAGVQYEIKAPSPTAGTVVYDVDDVRAGLRELVEGDVVDEQAAGAALERTITVQARVAVDVDLEALAATVSHLTAIGDVAVSDVAVAPSERVMAAGMNRLTKIGGAAADLVKQAERTGPAPRRRAKVAAKRRDAR